MDIRLPKLGEGAESGVVVSIHVKEGDQIQKGQTLIELENEKAVAPIPSPASGTVKGIRVKEGDKISVGMVILTVATGEAEEPAPPPAPAAAPAQPAARQESPARAAAPVQPVPEEPAVAEPAEEPGAGELAPSAPPSVRRMARELGIDLRRVRGSASGGRIVLADVRAYIQRLQRLAEQGRPGAGAAPAPVARVIESIDFSKWGPVVKKRLSPLRQTVSRRMTENWNSIPHVTQFDEADVTRLMELRKQYGPAYEERGTKLTLTSFALRAVALTLKKHPVFNASLDEAAQELVFKDYLHVGLAVDTEHGLIVPVIRNVDQKSLLELSREVGLLAEKARDRKVSLEELQGGSFTISNQGGIGGAHFTPIINKPEVAILGLGRGAVKAVARDGKIELRTMLPLAISYDHRVIDGGNAARFTVDLVQALETLAEEAVRL